MNKIIILSLLFPCSLFPTQEINKSSLMAPHNLGNIALYHHENAFHIKQAGNYHKVHHYDVDPVLRKATLKQLAEFQKVGCIKVSKMNNGDYSLKAHVRGLGGGPICGWWAYMFAKSTMYSTLAVAAATTVGAAVIATGGGAVPAAIAAGAVGKGVAVSSAIAGGAAGAGIATAVGATNVGLAAVATGSSMGVVVAIEGASLGFGALFAGPWCP